MRKVMGNTLKGITVGMRKDGSVAVLWDDDTIEWYSSDEIVSLLV